MKVGIIGTINRDSIRLADGTIKEGWGGILYNIVALSDLIGDKAEIYPVCNIGRNHYASILQILGQLEGVHTDYIRKILEKNNHCHLTYLPDGEKTEILTGGVRRLTYTDLHPLLDCDFVLVNYISGRDLYLSSLQKLRRCFKGKIYIDLHSLTLGKRKDGSRFLRKPPGWEKVVQVADFFQMNRLELSILAGIDVGTISDRNSLLSAFETLMTGLGRNADYLSGRAYIITAGKQGCYVVRAKRATLSMEQVVAERRAGQGDTTGCGDCFSAGFIAGLLQNMDLRSCAKLANRAALNRLMERPIYRLLSLG
ncbi:MAG: carbohydrate kinase family protein [candidate division Zixibacteria bacterium]|nr:carbohydrate kinase family protein [candidate division Zixibacteria bacterium]